jgi:hypothetical protein
MPNRILKESICSSDSINELSWFEECLFYRLIVNCDDYGRFDGRTAIIKNRLFPLKDGITAKSVETALIKLVNAGMVVMYEFDGKPFLYLPRWSEHQSVRNKRSKYPDPSECSKVIASANNCKQLHANVPVIQSESESESNPNTNIRAHADEVFESFYARYPRHVDKADARKAWAKLKDAEYDSVIAGLEKWIPYFNGEEEQFIPHPATWLNKRRWESEPPKVKKQNAALKYAQTPISKTDFDALVVNLGEEDK